MGYSLGTEVEKEAPNRMNISHCINKVFHSLFPRIRPYLQTGFFPLAMWTPLGGCFRKVFGATFNNSKQVNASGTNSMTYFIYFVSLLHFLVFVKKANFNSLETCFLFSLYNIHKKMCSRSLN